jgi:DNA polymerase-3 subunit delta'
MARGTSTAVVPDTIAPPPRTNPELLGHEDAERSLRRLFEAGRLPHALLLSGPRGIGKATLAFRLARYALLQSGETQIPEGEGLAIPPESGVFRRIAASGHADLLTVERAYDPRRRRMRSEIVVDDTREIAAFLRLTSAEGGWRVVIVDGADEMNRNAANAVLKILEEPPQRTVLILVAHSPGRLLPTIRSRCRRLPLAPLPDDIVRRLLARYRLDLEPSQAEAVVSLAAGSIGRALDLAAAGGIDLYRSLLTLLARPQGIDPLALHGFADRLVRPEAEDAYRIFEDLITQLLARFARYAVAGMTIGETPEPGLSATEDAAFRHFAGRAPATIWAELRDQIGENFARADGLNLDRKQTILGAFFAIERAAG